MEPTLRAGRALTRVRAVLRLTYEDQAVPGPTRTQPTHLVICIGNEGAEDLQVLRVYRRLPDDAAESKGFLRVIDDSGEDYLYPEQTFLPLPLPRSLEQQLESLAAKRSRVGIA